MRMLNDLFSPPFKRFKPCQEHIFVFLWFIVGFSRYRPRNRRKASLLNRVFNWAISKICVFLCFLARNFWKPKYFWTWYLQVILFLWSVDRFLSNSLSNHQMKNFSGVIFWRPLKLHGPAHEWRNNGQHHRVRNRITTQAKLTSPSWNDAITAFVFAANKNKDSA